MDVEQALERIQGFHDLGAGSMATGVTPLGPAAESVGKNTPGLFTENTGIQLIQGRQGFRTARMVTGLAPASRSAQFVLDQPFRIIPSTHSLNPIAVR